MQIFEIDKAIKWFKVVIYLEIFLNIIIFQEKKSASPPPPGYTPDYTLYITVYGIRD